MEVLTGSLSSMENLQGWSYRRGNRRLQRTQIFHNYSHLPVRNYVFHDSSENQPRSRSWNACSVSSNELLSSCMPHFLQQDPTTERSGGTSHFKSENCRYVVAQVFFLQN